MTNRKNRKYRIEFIKHGRKRSHSDPLTDHYSLICGVSAIEVMDGGFGGHKHYLCQILNTVNPGIIKSGVITLDISKRVEIPCNCFNVPNDFNRRTNLDFNALSIGEISISP